MISSKASKCFFSSSPILQNYSISSSKHFAYFSTSSTFLLFYFSSSSYIFRSCFSSISLILSTSLYIYLYLSSIYFKIAIISSLCPSALMIISSASFSFRLYSSNYFCFSWIRLSPIFEIFVISLNLSAKALILFLLTTTCSTDFNLLLTEFIFYFKIFS